MLTYCLIKLKQYYKVTRSGIYRVLKRTDLTERQRNTISDGLKVISGVLLGQPFVPTLGLSYSFRIFSFLLGLAMFLFVLIIEGYENDMD